MGINKIVQYGRFCAKNGESAYPIFDIGTLFRSSRWLLPENLYIIRRPNYSPYSYFLNYSKIFYSKKVFFVPSNEHFFIKIKIFKLAQLRSLLGVGPKNLMFVISDQGAIHPYGPYPGRRTFVQMQSLFMDYLSLRKTPS